MPSISETILVKPRVQLGGIYLRFCRINLSFGGSDLSLGGNIGLNRIVEILLANRLLFGQWNIAIHVELGLDLIRFGLRELLLGIGELRFGLIECCLKGSRIDLEQRLALPDVGTFGIVLSEQIPSHLRLNLGVDHPIQGADPLLGNSGTSFCSTCTTCTSGGRGFDCADLPQPARTSKPATITVPGHIPRLRFTRVSICDLRSLRKNNARAFSFLPHRVSVGFASGRHRRGRSFKTINS